MANFMRRRPAQTDAEGGFIASGEREDALVENPGQRCPRPRGEGYSRFFREKSSLKIKSPASCNDDFKSLVGLLDRDLVVHGRQTLPSRPVETCSAGSRLWL